MISPQLKKDLKTIATLLIYFAALFCFFRVTDDHPYVFSALTIILLSYYGYRCYSRKWKSSTIIFPTVNDPAESAMPYIAAIVFISIAVICYFAFHANLYFCFILVGLGILSYLTSFAGKPSGWLEIKGYKLRLVGVAETFDTRYVTEIVLKNEKIKITTLNGESNYSFVTRLTPEISVKLKQFLDGKLSNGGTKVINEVWVVA